MSDLDLNIDFVYNEDEAKAASERIRRGLLYLGLTAEDAAKKLLKNFDPAIGILKQVDDEVNKLKKHLKEATNGVDIESLKAKYKELAAFQDALRKNNASTKSSFNSLQNSINQITRELPAATYGFQTFAMGASNNIPMLADDIKRLVAINKELIANGQKVTPVWKQVLNSFFSWNTLMSVGITLMTVYGKEIGNFFKALFQGSEAIDAAKERWRLLTEAFKSGELKKAVVDVNELKINIDLAKRGMLDKETVVKQYNGTIGKTTGLVSDLKQAEKELQANADSYVKMMLYKAAANLALEEAAKKSLDAELSRRKKLDDFKSSFEDANIGSGGTGGFGTGQFNAAEYEKNQKRQIEARKKRQQEEIKISEDGAKMQIDIAKKFQEDAAKIASKNGFNFFGDNKEDKDKSKSLADALAGRKDVLDKIQALDDEYRRKSFDKDKEEQQALRDKFKELRKIIEEENKKIAEYNKKNKTSIATIDVGLVQPIENKAMGELVQKQGFEKDLKGLDELKKAFTAYEEFKTKTSKTEADKRFEIELSGFENYGQALQSQIDTINKTPAENLSRAQMDMLDELNKRLDEYAQLEEKKFDELLAKTMSYEQKRTALISAYQEERQKLVKKGKTSEAIILDTIHNEALLKLDDENTKKLDAYKDLYKGIENISDQAATKVIADAQKMLDLLVGSGKISYDLAKEIAEKLKDSQRSLEDRLPQRLQKLGSELRNIASLVGDVEFGEWLAATGDVLNNLGSMKAQINAITKDWGKMSTLDKLGAGAGLFGAGMGIVGTVNNLFAKAEQRRQEQAEYATNMQLKQYEAINKALERQIALIGKLYDTDKITAYSEAQRKAAENQALFLEQLQGRSLLTGNQEIDKYITANNTGYRFGNAQDRSIAAGIKDKYGAYDFAKASVEDLQRLLDGNKLDDATAKIVQNLIDAKKAAGELGEALKVDLTRTNFEDLRKGIIDAVTKGGDEASKNLNNIFRNSLLAFLEDDPILKTRIAKWYEDFAAASENGLTSTEIAKLRAEYLEITKYADKKKKELEGISGEDLNDPDNSPSNGSNTIKGDFKNLSEETGSVLAGRMAGVQLSLVELLAITKENNNLSLSELREQTLLQIQIANNTYRVANNSDHLPAIKTALESMDKKMSSTANALAAQGGK